MTETAATVLPPSPEEGLRFETVAPQIEKLRTETSFQQAEAEARELLLTNPERLVALYALYREQALTDPLTGLGNRRAFETDLAVRISRANRQAGKDGSPMPFVLMFIDADGLKAVNDSPDGGHELGDRYLIAISDTLKNIRENEGAFRLGGDEFAVTLEDATEEGAGLVVKRFLEIFNQLRTERNLPLHTGLSIGISQWKDGTDPLDLIARADEALYKSKSAKKNVR